MNNLEHPGSTGNNEIDSKKKRKLDTGPAVALGASAAFALSGLAVLDADRASHMAEYFLDATEIAAIYDQAKANGILRQDAERLYLTLAPKYLSEKEQYERQLHENLKLEIQRILKEQRPPN